MNRIFNHYKDDPRTKYLCDHASQAFGAQDEKALLQLKIKADEKDRILIACEACQNKLWRSTPFIITGRDLPEFPGWKTLVGVYPEEAP